MISTETENHGVGGSIPPLGTNKLRRNRIFPCAVSRIAHRGTMVVPRVTVVGNAAISKTQSDELHRR